MEKLYVIVRRDLSSEYQAVQSIHAAVNFVMENPEIGARWFRESNTLVLLSVSDEEALYKLVQKAQDRGITAVMFKEPDIGDRVTAIALEPGTPTSRLCKNLPKWRIDALS